MAADAAPFRDRPQPVGGSRRGIPNRRTVELRQLYLKMGLPHPVLAMGAVLRLGIDGIKRELGCELLDAAELYRKIAADVAPYIEGKQPTRVAVMGSKPLPVLVIGETGEAIGQIVQAREDGVLAIDDAVEASLVSYQRNQELRRAEPEASQDRASHAGPNALKDR